MKFCTRIHIDSETVHINVHTHSQMHKYTHAYTPTQTFIPTYLPAYIHTYIRMIKCYGVQIIKKGYITIPRRKQIAICIKNYSSLLGYPFPTMKRSSPRDAVYEGKRTTCWQSSGVFLKPQHTPLTSLSCFHVDRIRRWSQENFKCEHSSFQLTDVITSVWGAAALCGRDAVYRWFDGACRCFCSHNTIKTTWQACCFAIESLTW